MTLTHLTSLAAALVTSAQAAAGSFTAENVAARPEVVARGLHYLNGAYVAIWIILAAYLLSLSIRLRRLSLQVRRLRDRLG